MRLRRRDVVAAMTAAATLAALAADVEAAPAALTPAAAINLAGRERMLTQRTAKAYLMLVLQIDPPRARAILDQSTARFDAQLAELARFVATPDAQAALKQLEQRWSEYRAVLAAPPGVDGAREVYGQSEVAQEAAHRLTLALERAAGTPADRLVNVAGRQRMLAQRIAKYALFIAAKVQPHAARMELNLARSEFSAALYQLAVGPHTDGIGAQLQRLDAEWAGYRAVLDRPPTAATLAELVDRSERMLEVSETLVSLYESGAGAAPAQTKGSGAAASGSASGTR